jgi:putative transposase
MRHSINRGTPFGAADWVGKTATALGLESSLRPRGRPRGVKT